MEPSSGVVMWEMTKYAHARLPVPNPFVQMTKLLPIKIPTWVKPQNILVVLMS